MLRANSKSDGEETWRDRCRNTKRLVVVLEVEIVDGVGEEVGKGPCWSRGVPKT